MLRGWQVFCRCAESSSHTGPSIASHPSSTAPVFLHSRLRAYPSRPGGGHVPPFALIFNHAITTERPAGVLPTTHTGGHKQNRTTGPSQPASQSVKQTIQASSRPCRPQENATKTFPLAVSLGATANAAAGAYSRPFVRCDEAWSIRMAPIKAPPLTAAGY